MCRCSAHAVGCARLLRRLVFFSRRRRACRGFPPPHPRPRRPRNCQPGDKAAHARDCASKSKKLSLAQAAPIHGGQSRRSFRAGCSGTQLLPARIDLVTQARTDCWLATVDGYLKTPMRIATKSIVHRPCDGCSNRMERIGAIEQSHSVGLLMQMATPSHLRLITSQLHHGMPTRSVAHARNTVRPS